MEELLSSASIINGFCGDLMLLNYSSLEGYERSGAEISVNRANSISPERCFLRIDGDSMCSDEPSLLFTCSLGSLIILLTGLVYYMGAKTLGG
jgi:hypothetical protein